jgi:hypothetical protein
MPSKIGRAEKSSFSHEFNFLPTHNRARWLSVTSFAVNWCAIERGENISLSSLRWMPTSELDKVKNNIKLSIEII